MGGHTINLLGPDLLAEIVIHICTTGEAKMYFSKPEALSPQLAAQITTSIIQAAMEFGRTHNVQVQFQAPPAAPTGGP